MLMIVNFLAEIKIFLTKVIKMSFRKIEFVKNKTIVVKQMISTTFGNS
jgi:hypothetical protein